MGISCSFIGTSVKAGLDETERSCVYIKLGAKTEIFFPQRHNSTHGVMQDFPAESVSLLCATGAIPANAAALAENAL